MCAVCAGWVGVSGALNFNTMQQHLHAVFHFGFLLQQKGKEMCDMAYCHRWEKQRGQSRVQQYSNKVSPACFFPLSLSVSVSLSAALMRFHENSEKEQVGVVAPGVGTTKLNTEEAVLEDFYYLCFYSQSSVREFKERFYLCTNMALHMYKQMNIAHSYTTTHRYTLKNIRMHIKDWFWISVMWIICSKWSYPSQNNFKSQMNLGMLHIDVANCLYSKRATVATGDFKSLGNVCIRQL